jgi:hypothetical protein
MFHIHGLFIIINIKVNHYYLNFNTDFKLLSISIKKKIKIIKKLISKFKYLYFIRWKYIHFSSKIPCCEEGWDQDVFGEQKYGYQYLKKTLTWNGGRGNMKIFPSKIRQQWK